MPSSRSKALVVATVTGIQDTYVIYPYCTVCYGKLNNSCHFNKWSCIQCQISYESDSIPYQYCLRLSIADETSYCNISVFGKMLQPYFGLAAIEMQKILDLQHPDQIMEALKITFIGKSFIFEFKTHIKKNSSNLCLLSVIKKNGNSLFGSNLIAYQMISNSSVNNDTVYSYLMQSNQLTYPKMLINKSHSLQISEIIDFESSISCSILSYDSTSQESIVLSWETKQSDCQNLKIPLTVSYSNKCSSSPFLLDSSHSKVRELTFPDKKKSLSIFYHSNFDKNKSLFKERNQTLPSKQLHFLFTETPANIKTDFKNESKKKEICPQIENISVREMYKDEIENFGNSVDLEKAISVNLNKNRKSVSHIIESEDLSTILNDFDERICKCSLKIIETCKQHFIQKSSLLLCSANSSLYSLDVSNSIKELFELTNHSYFPNVSNLSQDLFETTCEKGSNFSEKCNASNHCQVFLKSTPNLQKENMIMSFCTKPNKSLLLCSHTPDKVFSHLLEDSNDSQFFCSSQSHTERKSNSPVIIPALQRKRKQIDNSKTVFSQNKVNKRTVIFRQNDSYESSKSTGSKRNVKKCMHKANLICHPFKSCTSPASSFNKLTSKSSYIAKIKTNICRKTFSSTPISVTKNVPALISAKNCVQSYDAFGTPIQRTDFIQEGIYCDSPSFLQKESPHLHGSSPEQNEASFDLFTSSNDSHRSLSLSLQVSPKNMNEFSQDLFSQESNQSPISSVSKYFNKNNYMTPVSLNSTDQYPPTHSPKNYHCLTKRNILQKADGFIDSTFNKEHSKFHQKNMNEFSQDLFSQESNQSPISSVSKYFNKNNYMTPVSLKSTDQYPTHSQKNYRCLTKRNILQKADGFIDSTFNKEHVPLNSEIKQNL